MDTPPQQLIVMIPKHLADAIEWVLAPSKDSLPDLTRLTSGQMQLLPLPVAQAFMDLALAAQQRPASQQRQSTMQSFWADAKTTQRARRQRQRASSLAAARQRLYSWYIQTANAQERRRAR